MQKIEYKASPSPHIVIKNFLSTPAARDCLAEAQWLETAYVDAKISGMSEDSDGCEECEAEIDIVRKGVRQNKVVYMDGYYEGHRAKSKILKHLEQAITEKSFVDAFKSFPDLFPIAVQTTHMETILSSYGMCDFYGWHLDYLPPDVAPTSRVITCVVHWNTEPKQYKGGELILTGATIEDQLPYEPVHNTAIFFQSNQCIHGVDDTIFEGEFKDSRFSINLWLGFDGRADISDNLPGMAYKYR